MKIVLNGYRASGKSTVGWLVAKALNLSLRDVDRGIEQQCGTTIAEIFADQGEPYYREVEHQVLQRMLCAGDAVISLGGGTIMTPANEKIVREDADTFVVYLKASGGELWERMEADPETGKNRPNLSCGGKEEVMEMLVKREPIYERSADLILDATQPPQTLSQIIINAMKQKQEVDS